MNRIKELREAKGVGQKEFAIDMGVAQPTVSNWETGQKEPSTKNAKRIAEYFNVSVDYLLGVSDDSDQQKKPIEANVPDELLNSPIKLEALSVFSSLSAEDQQLFIELMRSRGKQ